MQTITLRSGKKMDSLTSLRGYLAIWVVLFHFWKDVLHFFPQLDFLSPIAANGQMAVPGFFMLSGFVLALNYGTSFSYFSLRNLGLFLLMRLARLYPVHGITLLIVLVMVVAGRQWSVHSNMEGYSLEDFVLNIFLIHTWVPHFSLNWNYPSWSISSEWFVYILFPALSVYLFSQLKTLRTVLFLIFLSLGGSIAWMFARESVVYYEMLLVVPLFILGAALFYLIRLTPWSFGRSENSQRDQFSLGVGVCFLLILGAGYFSDAVKIPAILIGFSILIFVLALFGDRPSLMWGSALPVLLGDVSYSLYMTHTLAQKVLYRWVPSERFIEANVWVRLGIALVYIVLIFIFCAGIYLLIEKPSLRYFRKKIPRLKA